MDLKETAQELKEKVDGLLDKTEIDDKIKEGAASLKEKVDAALDKTDIDDKILEKVGDIKNFFTGKKEE